MGDERIINNEMTPHYKSTLVAYADKQYSPRVSYDEACFYKWQIINKLSGRSKKTKYISNNNNNKKTFFPVPTLNMQGICRRSHSGEPLDSRGIFKRGLKRANELLKKPVYSGS